MDSARPKTAAGEFFAVRLEFSGLRPEFYGVRLTVFAGRLTVFGRRLRFSAARVGAQRVRLVAYVGAAGFYARRAKRYVATAEVKQARLSFFDEPTKLNARRVGVLGVRISLIRSLRRGPKGRPEIAATVRSWSEILLMIRRGLKDRHECYVGPSGPRLFCRAITPT
jgi:hypothetical protein